MNERSIWLGVVVLLGVVALLLAANKMGPGDRPSNASGADSAPATPPPWAKRMMEENKAPEPETGDEPPAAEVPDTGGVNIEEVLDAELGRDVPEPEQPTPLPAPVIEDMQTWIEGLDDTGFDTALDRLDDIAKAKQLPEKTVADIARILEELNDNTEVVRAEPKEGEEVFDYKAEYVRGLRNLLGEDGFAQLRGK